MIKNKRLTGAIALIFLAGILVLTPSQAWALTTTVLTPWNLQPGGGTQEWNLYDVGGLEDKDGIMEFLYGTVGTDWVRIDDDIDQIWVNPNGHAQALARYAGHTNTFGYFAGASGPTAAGTFDELVTVDGGTTSGDPPNIAPVDISFGSIDPDIPSAGTGLLFRFGLNDTNIDKFWSSLITDNSGDGDHMVTFEILNLSMCESASDEEKADPTFRCFVLGWEDLPLGSSDKDYNDLVVEVSGVYPLPEPATLLLLGTGLVGLGVWRRRRRPS